MFLDAENLRLKKNKKLLAWLTCYDFPMAKILDGCGLDALLVGDSLGEVIYGMDTTTEVTLEMMVLHTKAVSRGAKQTHIIGDMPYKTYETPKDALFSAKKLLSAGANSVKLENPRTSVVDMLVNHGVDVCGHVGLTPQTQHRYEKQGKTKDSKIKILEDAKRLEKVGCYAIVLEAVVSDLAKEITDNLKIPTIGIASGKDCDGQILVHYDLLGFDDKKRAYVAPYKHLNKEIEETGRFFRKNL